MSQIVDLESESLILSCILCTQKSIEQCAGILQAECFFSEEHRIIYLAMISLFNSRLDSSADNNTSHCCDMYSVTSWLKNQGLLGKAGGIKKITKLYNANAVFSHLPGYIDAVVEKWQRRALQDAGKEIFQIAQDSEADIETLICSARETINKITDNQPFELVAVGHQIKEWAKLIDVITPVYTSSLAAINDYIVGYEPGRSYVIAARTSMGKTQFTLYESFMLALQHQTPVIYYSLEMTTKQLQNRIISFLTHPKSLASVVQAQKRNPEVTEFMGDRIITPIQLQDFYHHKVSLAKHGVSFLSAEQRDTIDYLIKNVTPHVPFFIDDNPSLTIEKIRQSIKRIKCNYNKAPIVVIDYISMVGEDFTGKRGNWSRINRPQELKEIIYKVCDLAKEEETAFLFVSQVNRDPESRKDKRPMKSDIRECLTRSSKLTLTSGEQVSIADIEVGAEIISYGGKDDIVLGTVDAVWSTGLKPVHKLILCSGKFIEASGNHPILTQRGYVPLEELTDNDYVATIAKTTPRANKKKIAGLPKAWRNHEFIWSTIARIEDTGIQETFDITVSSTHCFAANTIVTHNSGALEERVDTIYMLYRDNYYNPEADDKLLEVNIAKNRDGKTGVLKLNIDLSFGCVYDKDVRF